MRRALLIVVLALAACIPRGQRPLERPPATAAVDQKAVKQCHADLRRDGVEFRILADRTFAGGCSALGAVQLLEIGTPVTNLGAMTCPLASRFARWTREAVQPAARQWLRSEVARIESFGTYACRSVNSQPGGRLSEHGRANAVDVAAFVLRNGRRVSVLEGWSGADEDVRAFLRQLHREGCRRFSVGLGPDANAFHRNHFHFDMGRGPYCR